MSLSTAGVVGVVMALLVATALGYVCGLLTGLLVRRKKNIAASSDLSAPLPYEEPLLTAQTSSPISLKENVAYGHFNS